MKSFFWKFLICLTPCALALWAVIGASYKYYEGESGGFKFGVDLVGGTILVYEIDFRKSQEAGSEFGKDPARDTNILAESLKRRIDPNDLYNITIRPAGGEGRIEIILPTGGTYRAEKAEKNWDELLSRLEKKYTPGHKIEVGRGRILELADQIQSYQSESLWRKELFNSSEAWARLHAKAREYWARLDNQIRGDAEKNIPPDEELEKRFDAIPVGDLHAFSDFIVAALANTQYATTPKTVQNWLKIQAWDETMRLARQNPKWKFLAPPDPSVRKDIQDDMERITPDSVNQLSTFIVSKGNIIGQSAIALLKPLLGDKYDRVDGPSLNDARDFIKKHYGPPLQEIKFDIQKYMAEIALGRELTDAEVERYKDQARDLSVEEVQRIKDLVSKVGSLEFRILANDKDDVKAIEDAKKVFQEAAKNPEFAAQIKKAAQDGLPPPAPRDETGKPKAYKIPTRGSPSWVTYSWVELGPQERRALNLDNAARNDSTRNTVWYLAKNARDKEAIQLPEVAGSSERLLLQGALFYSRECVDRNLPEDERRDKEVEYFVLTRDPEFQQTAAGEPIMGTQKDNRIDGSYLTNAWGAPGQDLRPTVHFTFSNAGGELFGNITRKNVSEATGPDNTKPRRHLAIILDGLVMSAPTINSEIRTQGQISGNFTQKEVDQLVNILRAGRLPATLKPQPVSESTIAATLGEDTIHDGVKAILVAYGAILLFMIVYYRFAGIVASIALMANLLIMVGFMVAVQATFTLSGLAGIVLTLGMAVDANVLIYERLREERERGASLLQAIRNGYDRALPTIIDTHVSSIFVSIVLYIVGNDNLKGFAISMIVGLLVSLFTSLYMTRFMFDFWQSKNWLTKLTMMRLFAKPDIDFMSIRYLMFGLTLGLSIAGLALFIGRIPNDLNIDFQGGTAYGAKLTEGVTFAQLREFVSDKSQKEYLSGVTAKEIPGSDGHRFEVKFKSGDVRTIAFANAPKGNTPQEREKDVEERASYLPDPSVELLINRTENPEIKKELAEGKSRNFVVRTIEKNPELVQACLDQLFRDSKGKELLAKVYAHYTKFENHESRLTFYKTAEEAKKGEKPTATASPSFVKTLFTRELRRSFNITDEKTPLGLTFDVVPEGASDTDGKYGTMKVVFASDTREDEATTENITKALQATADAFAARPLPDRLENFDSALATETRVRAMWAILASWAAMLVYLWFRFGNWTFGLAAVICLIHDLFFTLGAIAVCYFLHGTWLGNLLMLDDFKIDLPAVAALLTLVGYSCSDTIVVFDRIREVRGKNPDLTPKMLNDSVNQTLSRTILSSLTVWLVVFVLYCIGGPGLHLFAFVMVIGVIVGTYSSIYIAAPLLLMFGEGKHEEAPLPGAKAPAAQGAAV